MSNEARVIVQGVKEGLRNCRARATVKTWLVMIATQWNFPLAASLAAEVATVA